MLFLYDFYIDKKYQISYFPLSVMENTRIGLQIYYINNQIGHNSYKINIYYLLCDCSLRPVLTDQVLSDRFWSFSPKNAPNTH